MAFIWQDCVNINPKFDFMKFFTLLFLSFIPQLVFATTWLVGPGRNYEKPSQVSTLVSDGDTVMIDPVEYLRDVCIWKANDLFIAGNGGIAHLNADRTAYGGKAIWVVAGNNATISNIKFSNCSVVDRNGAGIRLEGTHLTVSNCIFKQNQNGILAGDNRESDILVESCEFDNNGAGDGFSHNIYINHVRSLRFFYNYVHHAYYGHELKSRAHKNLILYNRISNEDGDASYEIDLPNGGPALIMGNIIQQSKFSDNNTFISYAREGFSNPGPHNLYFVYNTVVNNEDKGILLNVQSKSDTILFANNLISGKLSNISGLPNALLNFGNIIHVQQDSMGFVDAEKYNYHLINTSPAIDASMPLSGGMLGYELLAEKEYVHPRSWKYRFNDGNIDVGCFELQQVNATDQARKYKAELFYNPNDQAIHILDKSDNVSEKIQIELYDFHGQLLKTERFSNSKSISIRNFSPGIYLVVIRWNNNFRSGTVVKPY